MTSRRDAPPRLAAWLIARVVREHAREVVLGDLHERFAARVRRAGEPSARRWYWKQAVGFLVRLPAARAAGSAEARNGAGGSRAGRSSGVLADVRLAGRTLRRRPGLALTATCILGLAVGANAAVFSVLNGVLVEELPFPEPDRLVMLWDVYPAASGMGDRSPITLEHYRAWAGRTDLFRAVGAFESTTPALVAGDWPERIDGALVTANLLALLGARPALGRLLVPEDEAPGAEPVVVLSHGLWAARFGADPDVVGRAIEVNGVRTRVVGVTTEDFWFYDPYSAVRSLTGRNAESARLWQPLPTEGFYAEERDYPRYRVIARLREGVTVEAAAAASAMMRRELPPTSAGAAAGVEVRPLDEQVVAHARPRLIGLLGAVALVMLIACVNLVGLLLVHLESRRGELALRVALGCGRGRLIRQLVTESTLLAAGGGLVGLLLSVPATRWLLAFVPRGLPLAHRVRLDVEVAAAVMGLALLAGATIGLVSAWRTGAGRLTAGMAAAPRTVAGSRASRRVHGLLVCTEVALSLVLLIAATLLLRSIAVLNDAETGFTTANVLTFEASPSTGDGVASDIDFFAGLEERIQALPGVLAVGSTSALPFSRWVQRLPVEVGGAAEGEPPRIDHRFVSAGYFDAIGLSLRAGRVFLPGDRQGAPPVAIVNEAFVARWMDGDPDPIGRTVAVMQFRQRAVRTIVGVVANVKHSALFEADLPIVYSPAMQSPLPFARFAVRTQPGAQAGLVEPIRRVAAELDPRRPLQDFVPFEVLVAQSLEEERFYTQVLTAFAASAVLLTLIGIYGVVSYTTRQRDREVGIRMALGAGAASVHRLVVGQGLVPVAIGLAVGLLGAFASTRLLRGLLHGVPEQDVVSFTLATGAFALVAAMACMVPARRAARLDPVQVLRGE